MYERVEVGVTSPPTEHVFGQIDSNRLIDIIFGQVNVSTDPYLPWDELRYRKPPDGLTHEEWWVATRLARNSIMRALPRHAMGGTDPPYALPDEVLRLLDEETASKRTNRCAGTSDKFGD